MKLSYLHGRHREPELMDAKDLDPARHAQALRALARVNWVSLVAVRVWREVLHMSRGRRAPGGAAFRNPLRARGIRALPKVPLFAEHTGAAASIADFNFAPQSDRFPSR